MRAGVAVIGCGHWGKNLARSFAELGALRAVCDSDPVAATMIAEQRAVPAESWGTILAAPEIAGVAIAAPAALHAGLASAALTAGKDVFVEKPLAVELAEAETLVAQACAAGRILMVGHLLQYHPAFQTLKTLVAEGALGELRYLYSNRLNFGRLRREENVLWSFAPHDISMILNLVGSAPTWVEAQSATYLNPGIADFATVQLGFAGGVRGHIQVSWLNPFKEQKLVVVGSEAMAVFDDRRLWDEKLLLYRHSVADEAGQPVAKAADGEPIIVTKNEPLRLECQQFLDSMTTRQAPPTDGAEGLRVLGVLAAAQAKLELSPLTAVQ